MVCKFEGSRGPSNYSFYKRYISSRIENGYFVYIQWPAIHSLSAIVDTASSPHSQFVQCRNVQIGNQQVGNRLCGFVVQNQIKDKDQSRVSSQYLSGQHGVAVRYVAVVHVNLNCFAVVWVNGQQPVGKVQIKNSNLPIRM